MSSRVGSAPIQSDLQGGIQWRQGQGLLNLASQATVVRPVADGGSVGDIQRAIDKVSREGGGTVFIRNGTYQETDNITLKSAVSLVGEKESTTIIDFNSLSKSVTFQDTGVYTTGTIASITSGVMVTGSGTSWLANVSAGQYLFLQNRHYLIAAVTSDTTLILSEGYIGNATLPGAAYRISTILRDIDIRELTIKNSAADGIAVQGARNFIMENVQIQSNNIGIDFDNVTEFRADNTFVITSTSDGIQLASCGFFNLNGMASISNGGNGWTLSSCETVPLNFCAANGNTGDGINVTGCTKCLFSVEATGNGGQGIQFVSGSDLNFVERSLITNNTSDGLELTATCDRNIITANVFRSNGAYGVDIAASTCDKNLIHGNQFLTNTSGTINDSGTSTTSADNVT